MTSLETLLLYGAAGVSGYLLYERLAPTQASTVVPAIAQVVDPIVKALPIDVTYNSGGLSDLQKASVEQRATDSTERMTAAGFAAGPCPAGAMCGDDVTAGAVSSGVSPLAWFALGVGALMVYGHLTKGKR